MPQQPFTRRAESKPLQAARRGRYMLIVVAMLPLLVTSTPAAPIQWMRFTGGWTTDSYRAGAIRADAAGDVIVTGNVTHNAQARPQHYSIYTAKYSGADGRPLWEHTGPLNSHMHGGGKIVRVDTANDVVVAGDGRLIKHSGVDGRILWQPPDRAADLMEMDSNNDVVVAGGGSTGRTAKYFGGTGALMWETFSVESLRPHDIAIDRNGHVIVAGYLYRMDSSDNAIVVEYYVTKYDGVDGHVWWQHRYARNTENANHVATDASGNVLVAGVTSADEYVIKLGAADGKPIWTQRMPGSPRRDVTDMAVANSGNVVVVGHHALKGYDSGTTDPWTFYTAMYSGSDGSLLWERRKRGGDDHQGGEAKSVKIGSDDTVFVSGWMWFGASWGDFFRYEIHTVAYASIDGAPLWGQRHVPPSGGFARPARDPLALLPDGNVAVLSTQAGPATNDNFLTIKYSTAGQLLNMSTRARVQPGDDGLIGGFIVTGSSTKTVLLRTLGPSLPLGDTLQDPVLELHRADGSTVRNDDWKDAQQAEITATLLQPANEKECAIVAVLPPGAHTAVVRGKNGGAGVALVEIYDISAGDLATSANISTRGRVGANDNVMIGGFILGTGGMKTTKVLVRAIGPSLSTAGVSNPLRDPTLQLHDGNGNSIASNDNWKDFQAADIQATGIPPSSDRESAIVQALAPGHYTAVVRGKDNTSGVGLIEVYNLQ